MPRFRYTAYDVQGKPLKGEVEGANESFAVQALQKEGLVPVELWMLSGQKEASGKRKRQVPLEDHLLFCRSLAGYL